MTFDELFDPAPKTDTRRPWYRDHANHLRALPVALLVAAAWWLVALPPRPDVVVRNASMPVEVSVGQVVALLIENHDAGCEWTSDDLRGSALQPIGVGHDPALGGFRFLLRARVPGDEAVTVRYLGAYPGSACDPTNRAERTFGVHIS